MTSSTGSQTGGIGLGTGGPEKLPVGPQMLAGDPTGKIAGRPVSLPELPVCGPVVPAVPPEHRNFSKNYFSSKLSSLLLV